jgi:uncharacterized protein YndB with AHSA1/START domain
MSNDIITKSIVIAATTTTGFEFLIDKDKLGLWYHAADDNLTEGADYVLRDKDGKKIVWGRVLVLASPSLLETTFCIGPFGDAETKVKWQLDEVAGGTRLTLAHSGISDAAGDAALNMLQALDKGWDAHLGRLRAAL